MGTYSTPTHLDAPLKEPGDPNAVPGLFIDPEGDEPGDYWAHCKHNFACLMQFERFMFSPPERPSCYPDRHWQNRVAGCLGCSDGLCDCYEEE